MHAVIVLAISVAACGDGGRAEWERLYDARITAGAQARARAAIPRVDLERSDALGEVPRAPVVVIAGGALLLDATPLAGPRAFPDEPAAREAALPAAPRPLARDGQPWALGADAIAVRADAGADGADVLAALDAARRSGATRAHAVVAAGAGERAVALSLAPLEPTDHGTIAIAQPADLGSMLVLELEVGTAGVRLVANGGELAGGCERVVTAPGAPAIPDLAGRVDAGALARCIEEVARTFPETGEPVYVRAASGTSWERVAVAIATLAASMGTAFDAIVPTTLPIERPPAEPPPPLAGDPGCVLRDDVDQAAVDRMLLGALEALRETGAVEDAVEPAAAGDPAPASASPRR